MIKVKITPMGGYVYGDGPMNFDPDAFLKAFEHKVMEAKARGLVEIGFDDATIQEWLQYQRSVYDDAIDNAIVKEYDDSVIQQLIDTDQQQFGDQRRITDGT
jgi:hypothetical protein